MRVKELIDKVIKIARESADNEDGGIQIYTDYRDRELSNETIKTLFESNNPRETLVEMVSDNEMNYSDNYGYYELIETINKRLTDEEREMFIENYDVIFDYIVENIYFYYDIEELNNEINVNIMVDCGNGNYDYARDNVLNWYGRYNDGEFDEESSILWLAKTQEKEKELKDCVRQIFREDINYMDREKQSDKFVESCIQELENLSSNMGTLTFLVKMPLFQVFDLLELQEEEYDENARYDPRENKKSNSYMVLGKDTTCGLYDSWNGGGSVLEIELDKDVKLPIKYAEICVEGCRMRGYDVNEVYGLIDSCWKHSLKDVVGMEK